MNKQPCIVILDFGSQYTQLIARRVRECGVYSEVFAPTLSAIVLRELQPTGIILSGGPDSVNATTDVPRIPDAVFEQGCPVLGICYGMQAMAKQLGGVVSASATREFGHTDLQFDTTSPLFKQIDGHSIVWMSHGDKVTECPAGFIAVAHSEHTPIAAMADPARGYYAVQFHPEVTHTESGEAILKNFLYDICGCEYVWSPEHIVEEQLTNIREAVKDERVILGLSGGVDSAVLAVLLHRAIGDQLTCLFIDNGLLRQGEAEQVMHVFGQQMGLPVVLVDARADFLSALAGISDPETKRKRIGKLFIDVFVREAKKLRDANWLAQGTIYPDVIESAANQHGTSDLIKSHHNVGGLPEQIGLKLLEPLRDLFKDEVRKIGHVLGLPDSMIYRHPFPGPGLAVRIAGEITEERLQIVRAADAIFMEMLRDSDFYGKVSQAFAVLLPVKSVGVVGDQRSYAEVIALRAVCTTDFMTATSAELPHTLLTRIASRIVNEVPGVSRVLYDITSKPPATIEWE